MINNAIIIPTGDEIKQGIVMDTDSPMIMKTLLEINNSCEIKRVQPVIDKEDLIIDQIKTYVSQDADLIILIGGSGGGHRYSSTLGKDYTHSSLDMILEKKYSTELYGKNGHMWCKLLCGVIGTTMVINVPGPFQEAYMAMKAFKKAYSEDSSNLKQINVKMAEAVKSQYGENSKIKED